MVDANAYRDELEAKARSGPRWQRLAIEALLESEADDITPQRFPADVTDLPSDLADLWREHYERIFPAMLGREHVYRQVDIAASAFPDLFEGIDWLPRAVSLIDAAQERWEESEREATAKRDAKRKATRKAQRQARKRNRR